MPNGAVVAFYPDTHTYVVNGVEVPSVTTMLSRVYGDTYAAVNPDILKRAADYGTAVHQELQEWIDIRKSTSGAEVVSAYPEVNNYFNLVEPLYKIQPIDTERVVVLYDPEGKPVAAGRFDLLCFVDGVLTLADFKTTSTIHKKLVTAQLNLYARAAAQSGYLQTENIGLGVIHLSGSVARFVPVPKLGEGFYLKFTKDPL